MSRLWARRGELLFALLFAIAVVFTIVRLRVDGSMAAFLPPASREVSELAQHVIDSTLSRTMLLSVGSDDPARAETARRVARELGRLLDGDRAVSWVLTGPSPQFERDFTASYFPRRWQFLEHDVRQLEEPALSRQIAERVARLERRLAGPEGPLVRPLAPEDPLGAFLGRLEAVGRARGPAVVEQQFVGTDGHALVLVGLRDSALDGAAQRGLLQRIDHAFAASEAMGLRLERSGVNVFSVDTEQRIRADVSRVSVLSTLGIALVFLLLFRSPFGLVLAALPVVFGFALATAATLLLFGRIHALTFAFGAALLGVAIDYPVHLLNHRRLSPDGKAGARVRAGILLGAVTTVVGIGALATSGFRVMTEVAVFSSVGLAAAAVFTLYLLPRLPCPRRARAPERLDTLLQLGYERLRAQRALLFGIAGALLVGSGLLLLRARWDTSLEGLAPMPPALLAEDARVRQRFGAPSGSLFVLVSGEDDEQALRRNDRVAEVLAQAQTDGLVTTHASLHDWLWSERLQRANFEAARDPAFAGEVRRALEPRFDVALFEPFFAAQRALRFDPLSLDALRRTTLRQVVDRFAVSEPGRTLILSYPEPTDDVAARELARRVEAIEGAHFVEQRRLLDEAYVALKGRVRYALLLGALGMALVVTLRFRSLRSALGTVIPAIGAPCVGLGAAALLGHSLNLFHLFAALVVLSMAMDYGIFASETLRGRGDEPGRDASARATLQSVVIAALTTCLGFGLLAVSSLPVLQAIGVTVAAGIVAALLLVPVALWAHGER